MEIKSVKEFDKEKYYNFAVSISDGMHGWSLTKKESKLLSIHMTMGSDCKELSHWSDGVIKINIQVSCKEEH